MRYIMIGLLCRQAMDKNIDCYKQYFASLCYELDKVDIKGKIHYLQLINMGPKMHLLFI